MIIKREVITSRNNSCVKWASSLSDKKAREEHCVFIAEGEKLSFEAMEAKLPITHVYILESKIEKLLPRVTKMLDFDVFSDTEVILVSDSVFEKISTEKAPQGIICVIKYLDFFRTMDIIYKEDFFLSPSERAIILSSVRDPGNLGSTIRSAVAFGVEHIILTADCADLYNPKTVRSAMGSLFRVKATVVADMKSLIDNLHSNGRRVFAAELSKDALPLGKISISPLDAVIIGNEGHGISPELSALCDSSVYIPISKKTESLNASVAAAIFMWEQSK